MQKMLVVLIVVGLFQGCNHQDKKEGDLVDEAEAFSFQGMPREAQINSEVQEILEDWTEYQALENSFSVLRRAANTEDLKLAIDDLIEKEKALAEGEYPEPFDKPQVKSRQQVLRTFLFKIKGSLGNRTDVQEPMEQMLQSYNAFRIQFGRLLSNPLDAKLILDGEEE